MRKSKSSVTKKATGSLLVGLVLLLCLQVGTVFAATTLEEKSDALIGTKYRYGGTTTSGFDCSGFTQYVFKQLEINLSRTSGAQSKDGTTVKQKDLRPGDLVFFNTSGKGISHVGIYLGDGEFIHSSTNKGVIKNKLSDRYYADRYVTASRVLTDEQYEKLAK